MDFTEILYADDTLLITNSMQAMNALIVEREEQSRYYNLRLNQGKCVAMSTGDKMKVKFQNGKQMQQKEQTVYLGVKCVEVEKSLGSKKEQVMQDLDQVTLLYGMVVELPLDLNRVHMHIK